VTSIAPSPIRRAFGRSLALGAALASCGCSLLQPAPDPTRLYVLTTTIRATPEASSDLVIGLGPVTVPRYLDRPEIMRRIAPNELAPSPTDRWGEPLESQIARTLGHDLTALLHAQRVVPFPWYMRRDMAAVVEVDILRFEAAADGNALVVARWRVRPTEGAGRTGWFTRSEPVPPEIDAQIAALSQMIGGLAEEIAAAVRDALAKRESRPTKG
jgi:uncharacterized lipoprotein YmbA